MVNAQIQQSIENELLFTPDAIKVKPVLLNRTIGLKIVHLPSTHDARNARIKDSQKKLCHVA